MTLIKTIKGRLPMNSGAYNSSKVYGKKYRCNLYGCEWESLMEGNIHAPATLVDGKVVPDTAHWRLVSGVPGNYGLDAKVSEIESDVKKLKENASGTGGGLSETQVQGKIDAAINALDAIESGTSADGKVKVEVTETDGKITGVNVTTNNLGSGSGTIDDAALKALEKKITDEQTTRENADNDILRQLNEEKQTRQSTDTDLQNKLNNEQQAREAGDNAIRSSVENSISQQNSTIEAKFYSQDKKIEDTFANQEALMNGKQLAVGAMEFDTIPTKNSGHGITSGGVKSYVDNIQTIVAGEQNSFNFDCLAKKEWIKRVYTNVSTGKLEIEYQDDGFIATKKQAIPGVRIGVYLPDIFTRIFVSFDYTKNGSGNIDFNAYNGEESSNEFDICNLTNSSGSFSWEGCPTKANCVVFSLNSLSEGETLTISNLKVLAIGLDERTSDAELSKNIIKEVSRNFSCADQRKKTLTLKDFILNDTVTWDNANYTFDTSSNIFKVTKNASLSRYRLCALKNGTSYSKATLSFDAVLEGEDMIEINGLTQPSDPENGNTKFICYGYNGHNEISFDVTQYFGVCFSVNSISTGHSLTISNLKLELSSPVGILEGDLAAKNVKYYRNNENTSLWTTTDGDNAVTIKKIASCPGHRLRWRIPLLSYVTIDFDYTTTVDRSYKRYLDILAYNDSNAQSNNYITLGFLNNTSGHFHYEGLLIGASDVGISINDLAVGETLALSNIDIRYTGYTDEEFEEKSDDVVYSDVYKDMISNSIVKFNEKSEMNRVGYIFITDLHLNSGDTSSSERRKAQIRQLKAVRELANKAPIDFIAFGGDFVDSFNGYDALTKMLTILNENLFPCSKPILFMNGNHDDGSYASGSTPLTKQQLKNLYILNSSSENIHFPADDASFYYLDLDKKKTRIIVLDYIDTTSKGTNYWGFSQRQVEWICEEALSTEYSVIIFSHGCLDWTYGGAWGLGDTGGHGAKLIEVLSAYNKRQKVTPYSKEYDFSSAKGRVKLAHCGHAHFDCEVTVGVPGLLTAAARPVSDAKEMVAQGYYTEVDAKTETYKVPDEKAANALHWDFYGYNFRYPTREINKKTECLFDLVSVNSDKINVFRVGAGIDRTINNDI